MPRTSRNPGVDAADKAVIAELSEQDTVRVSLYQVKPPEKPLPDKPVRFNGVIYQLQRGKRMNVPRTIYEILVQAGEVAPDSDEDEVYLPEVSRDPLSPEQLKSF